MKAPKSYFVENGLAELGLAGAVYDFPPEEMARICDRLDADLAELETKGARVPGWSYADEPGINNPASVVNVPTGLVKLLFLSAAIAAAPSVGKNLSSVTVAQLKLSRDNLMYRSTVIPRMQRNPNMPVGSGNQPWADGVQFYPLQIPQIDAGRDSHLDPDLQLWNGSNDIKGF